MSLETHLESPLAQAVRAAGGQSAFGRVIGRRQSTVRYWLENDLPLPAELAVVAEAPLGIPRWILRPDLFDAPAQTEAAAVDANQPDLFPDAAATDAIHGGVVPASAPVVACDRSAILHPEVPRG